LNARKAFLSFFKDIQALRMMFAARASTRRRSRVSFMFLQHTTNNKHGSG
jgi:hypothetical protein